MKWVNSSLVLLVCGMMACKSGSSGKENPDGTDTTAATPLEILNSRINASPMDPDLYYDRAQFFYDNQQAAPALTDIRKAISIDSLYSPFHLLYADLLYATGNIDSAALEIKTAIRLDPENSKALAKMGELRYYQQNYEEAFKYLDEALKVDPAMAEVYHLKGLCFKELGKEALAVSSFQTATEVDPDYFESYIQLGKIFAAKKNDVAIDYYTNAIVANPDRTEGYDFLAFYLQEQGRGQDAIKVYNDLLEVDPSNVTALHNIGWIYLYLEEDPETAITYFNKAISLDPNMATSYYHRGCSYESLGDNKAAKADFQNAITIDPEFAKAKERLQKL